MGFFMPPKIYGNLEIIQILIWICLLIFMCILFYITSVCVCLKYGSQFLSHLLKLNTIYKVWKFE